MSCTSRPIQCPAGPGAGLSAGSGAVVEGGVFEKKAPWSVLRPGVGESSRRGFYLPFPATFPSLSACVRELLNWAAAAP